METALAQAMPSGHLSAWECGGKTTQRLPEWLQVERPSRWINVLYAPDTPASGSYRPYRLTAAFDGIAYFPQSLPGLSRRTAH